MESSVVRTQSSVGSSRATTRLRALCGVLVGFLAVAAYAGSVTYDYDAQGRLRKVTRDSGTITNYTLDAAGNRTAVATGTDTVAPTVPTGLAGTPTTSLAVILTWNPSTDPEPSAGFGGYRVFRNGAALPDLSGTATTFTDTGLSPNTAYTYAVAAYDATGHVSTASSTISVTTLADTTPPQAPASFTAVALSSTGARLTWTAALDNVGVTSYVVDRCTGVNCSSNYVAVGTWTSGALRMDDLSLSPTITYGYRIVARDAALNTSPAITASVTTPVDTSVPTVPGNPTAAATGITTLHLAWQAATDNVGVVGYMISRCSGPACTSFTPLNSTPITALVYDDTGLTGGTLYRYKIKARDAAGNLSDDATTPIVSDTTTPAAPASITIPPSPNSTGSYTVSWTPSGGSTNVTYSLYESKNDPFFTNPGIPYSTTGTSFNISGKTDGTYSYEVQGCVTPTRCGPLTIGSSSVTVVLPPIAPATITVPTGSLDGSIAVSWATVSNATSYKLFESNNSSFTGEVNVYSGTSVSPPALTNRLDGDYWYRAQACNSSGCGGLISGGPTHVTRAPGAPGSISISSPTNTGSFTISWTAVSSGKATRYELYEATNSSFTGETKIDDKNGFSTSLSSRAQGSYWYRVRGCNETNCGSTAAVASPQLVDTTIPGAPGNTRLAGPTSQSTAVLNWDAASDNLSGIAGYEWRLTTTPTFTYVGNVLTVQVGGLSPQNSYTFEVRARDNAGNTGPVGSVGFTTAPPPPLAPTNLQFNQIADCAWNASWSASANATSYNVTQTNGQTIPPTSNTSVIINCTAGDPNSNKPKSVQACGVSGCSSFVDFGAPVDITKPTAPGTIVLGTVYPTSVTATWPASYDLNGIASYQYSLNGGGWTPAGASPSLSLTSLTPQTNYTLAVRGLDPANNASDPSPTVSFSTPAAPDVTKPSDVTNVRTTTLQQDFITFAWDAATDNVGVVGYNYKLSSSPTWTVSGLTQSVSYSGLTQQTAYTFQIQARDGAGNLSANITQFTVTTPAGIPNSPLNAYRVQGGSCWWNATWDPPSGPGTVTYYQVRESSTGNIKQVNPPSTSTTVNFSDCSNPSSNMPQWVKACNTYGCSASAAFTTR